MSRLVLAATGLLFCFSSCAVMHTVTGDAMFAPDEPVNRTVKGPVVPEAEPTEPPEEPLVQVRQSPRLDDTEDELAPLPAPSASSSKKKSTNVAMKK